MVCEGPNLRTPISVEEAVGRVFRGAYVMM